MITNIGLEPLALEHLFLPKRYALAPERYIVDAKGAGPVRRLHRSCFVQN
jgi:hypothetical protein